MSKFLAPIHTWLFKKILILENIEKNMVTSLGSEDAKLRHQALRQAIGDYIPEAPLENLIDVSNIHGWLQEQITLVETRQAAYVADLLKEDDQTDDMVAAIYEAAGKQLAEDQALVNLSPGEIFAKLNDVLLEGMPCDRVNQVLVQEADQLIWLTKTCVHKGNWESAGVDVRHYYKYRAAFIKGFVAGANDTLTYQYEIDKQEHKISA